MLADHNADRKNLFAPTGGGKAYLKEVPLSDAERFVIKQLWSEYEDFQDQLRALTKKLKAFAAKAPAREAEARQILKTAPGVGFVTAEVILSELGDVSRFRNAKAVCAYAGLVPVVRQSGGKRSKDLAISKQGSGLLRWALVESAWRLVNTSVRWSIRFGRLKARGGSKRAIVAVARRMLCVLYAMLRTSTPYKHSTEEAKLSTTPEAEPSKPPRKLRLKKSSPKEAVTT
jgi:transposase